MGRLRCLNKTFQNIDAGICPACRATLRQKSGTVNGAEGFMYFHNETTSPPCPETETVYVSNRRMLRKSNRYRSKDNKRAPNYTFTDATHGD